MNDWTNDCMIDGQVNEWVEYEKFNEGLDELIDVWLNNVVF
jgi:hypothetical protein